jgi:hypothetical protein
VHDGVRNPSKLDAIVERLGAIVERLGAGGRVGHLGCLVYQPP